MFADTLTNDTEEHLMHVKEKHLLLTHAFTNACIWDIHISLLAKKTHKYWCVLFQRMNGIFNPRQSD